MVASGRTHPTPGRAWAIGCVAGAAVGIPSLGLAVIGVVLVSALIGGAALARPRLASLGGVLVGIGAAWTLVLGRATAACAEDACEGPDLTPVLVLAAAFFVAGLGLSIAAAARVRSGT
jgi:hypothetical protein